MSGCLTFDGALYAPPRWVMVGFAFMLFSFLSSLGILQYFFLLLISDRPSWQASTWKWIWLILAYLLSFLLAASFVRLERMALFVGGGQLFVLRGKRIQWEIPLEEVEKAQILRPVLRNSTLRGTFHMLYCPLVLRLKNGEQKEGFIPLFGIRLVQQKQGLSSQAAASVEFSKALSLTHSAIPLPGQSLLRSLSFSLILLFFGWFHGVILFIYWSQ